MRPVAIRPINTEFQIQVPLTHKVPESQATRGWLGTVTNVFGCFKSNLSALKPSEEVGEKILEYKLKIKDK